MIRIRTHIFNFITCYNILEVVLTMILSSITLVSFSQINIDRLYPSDSIISKYHNDWTQKHYRDQIKAFKADPLHTNEIVFIGNSITEQGKDWSSKFEISSIRNRGIAGDLTDGVLKRLNEITYYKPKAVFILIGINDLYNMHHEHDTRFKYNKIIPSTEYIAQNIIRISKIIARKSPQTKIFIRTILPTRKEFLKDDILTINKILKQQEDKSPYQLIDLHNQFVDPNGLLIKTYTKDGTHLNDAGYQHWIKYEKHILQNIN